MVSVESMSCRQDRTGMEVLRCMHSAVAADWRNILEVPDRDETVESFNVLFSPEIKVRKLRHDDLFLCTTQSGDLISHYSDKKTTTKNIL